MGVIYSGFIFVKYINSFLIVCLYSLLFQLVVFLYMIDWKMEKAVGKEAGV